MTPGIEQKRVKVLKKIRVLLCWAVGLVSLSGAGGADRRKTMWIDGIADNRFPLRGRRPDSKGSFSFTRSMQFGYMMIEGKAALNARDQFQPVQYIYSSEPSREHKKDFSWIK